MELFYECHGDIITLTPTFTERKWIDKTFLMMKIRNI